jgi:hypothetical protein
VSDVSAGALAKENVFSGLRIFVDTGCPEDNALYLATMLSLRANLVSFRSGSHRRRGGIGRRAGLKIQ